MSNQLEDVYDIVLKWGTIYHNETSNLMFMNKFMYQSGKTLQKKLLVRSDGIMTKTACELIEKLTCNEEWDGLINLMSCLRKHGVRIDNIIFNSEYDHAWTRWFDLNRLLHRYLVYLCRLVRREDEYKQYCNTKQLQNIVLLCQKLGFDDDDIIEEIERSCEEINENYYALSSFGEGYGYLCLTQEIRRKTKMCFSKNRYKLVLDELQEYTYNSRIFGFKNTRMCMYHRKYKKLVLKEFHQRRNAKIDYEDVLYELKSYFEYKLSQGNTD